MNKYQKYIKLIVEIGLSIWFKERILIWCPVHASDFAHDIRKELYRSGANFVEINWVDDVSDNYCLDMEWVKSRNQYWEDAAYKMLWIYSPLVNQFEDLDSSQSKNTPLPMPSIPWIVVSVPNISWARTVYPNIPSSKKVINLMWNAIFTACRIDNNDPIANWQAHITNLQSKTDVLNQLNLQQLSFKNSQGTELMVKLPANHLWLSCVGENASGQQFFSNIPTEEVFTVPLRTGVDGIVYSTKPMVYMGLAIDGFWFRFKNGRIVEYGARKNQNMLEQIFLKYKNADYLGEVAIVPQSSPLSQQNILWYDSSFDENASCHLALGYGYSHALQGAAGKTQQQQQDMGINQSDIHQDFMIGSIDMDIEGMTKDGKIISILANGNWVI